MKKGVWFAALLICLVTAFPVLAQSLIPIGNVDTVTGRVMATSLDGSRLELAQGDPVYQGYTLETGEGAVIGVVLTDESVFSLDENGRLTLDILIYDRDNMSGSSVISMAEGIFTLVSGQVAKTSPDAMVIKTPSAIIGIRGTAMGLTVNSLGGTVVAMLEEAGGGAGGEVVVSNKGGSRTINRPYQAVNVDNMGTRPSMPFMMSLQEMGIRFGGAMQHLPMASKRIHKKIRNEAARQFRTRKAEKTARQMRHRMINQK